MTGPSRPPTTPSPVKPPSPSTLTSGKLIAWAGVIVAAFGFLNTQAVMAVLPTSWAPYVVILGAVVAKFGALLHTDQSTNGTS